MHDARLTRLEDSVKATTPQKIPTLTILTYDELIAWGSGNPEAKVNDLPQAERKNTIDTYLKRYHDAHPIKGDFILVETDTCREMVRQLEAGG